MNSITEILQRIRPGDDFQSSSNFFAAGLLDSFDLIALVLELNKQFNIAIDGSEIVPENFQNLEAIANLLKKHGVDASGRTPAAPVLPIPPARASVEPRAETASSNASADGAATVNFEAALGPSTPITDLPKAHNKKFVGRRLFNRWLSIAARFLPGATTLRPFIHRLRGVKIGKNLWIGDDVYLENEFPEYVDIGDNVNIGLKAIIMAHSGGPGRIIIEDEVFIGPAAMISCPAGRSIRIGKGAVIGPGSIITSSIGAQLFVLPPKSKAVGRAGVSLAVVEKLEDFLKELKPLPPGRGGNGELE